MVETQTFTIEGSDGDTDAVELPTGLVDALSEQGDEQSTVVADITCMAFAQRAHAIVHHAEGETPADLEAVAESMEDIFEDRFGVSFGEATGHHH